MTKEYIENFISKEKNKFILIYFTATWCGPCNMFKRVLDAFLEKNSKNIECIKIDVDGHRDLSLDYDISSVPTLLFFKNNSLVQRRTGTLDLAALEGIISNI